MWPGTICQIRMSLQLPSAAILRKAGQAGVIIHLTKPTAQGSFTPISNTVYFLIDR